MNRSSQGRGNPFGTMFASLHRPLVLAAALLCGSAHSSPFLIVSGGTLMGANGIVVEGISYDVAFRDGTCAELFTGCNESSDFAFTSESSATAAAQTLLDEVFVNGLLGAFDNQPWRTFGCPEYALIGTGTLFYDSCNALTPYGVSLLNNRSRVGVASNLSVNELGLADEVFSEAPLLTLDTAVPNMTSFGHVWAVWKPSAVVVDPPPVDPPPVDPPGTVPEPSSLLLAGAGLALLRRRRSRRPRMTQRVVFVAAMFLLAPAFAQDIAFTADAAKLQAPLALVADPDPKAQLDRFRAGDAVWGVLRSAPRWPNVSRYISLVNDSPVIQVQVWILNEYQNWDPLFTTDIPVTREVMQQTTFAFPILPDKYDSEAPGLRKLLDRLPDYGKKPVTLKVRIEGAQRFGGVWLQSGFVLDLSQGLGRHADWIAQKKAADADEKAAREKPLISARSAWIRTHTPPRNDPRFNQEVGNWWAANMAASSPLLKVFACGGDYQIVRNDLGYVLRKQTCGLAVFRWTKNGRCYAQWRNFGYESLGGGAFDTQLKAWEPTNLLFHLGNEKIDAGKPYEVDCSAVDK